MKNKRTLPLIVFTLLSAGRLSAQLPVVDGAQISQNWLQHLEDLARYVQMIENQVQQITTLTQQLAQLQFVSKVIGNPAAIQTLPGLASVVTSINGTNVGQSRSALLSQTTATIAHLDNGRGLYRPVGESFQTQDGVKVQRQTDAYKPLAAVIQMTANHDAVYEDVTIRRRVLRDGLRDTLQQLRAATTDAESQKLQGVLLGQMAELTATDHEADFAAQRALVQDLANRNDRLRQAEAHREEQATEISAAVTKLTDLMRPNTQPLKLSKPGN